MRRSVSHEKRNELEGFLIGVLHSACSRRMYTEAEVQEWSEWICRWYESQNSFTDIVSTDSKVSKSCPTCGKLDVIYKKHFDTNLLPALRAYHEAGVALNNDELSAILKNQFWAKKKAGYATELRLWELIEKTEPEIKRNARYVLTDKGARFLRGEERIPYWLWTWSDGTTTHKAETPEGKPPAPLLTVDQMQRLGRKERDPVEMVEEAMPHNGEKTPF